MTEVGIGILLALLWIGWELHRLVAVASKNGDSAKDEDDRYDLMEAKLSEVREMDSKRRAAK